MRAFLIDPEAMQITEVDYNGDFRQIYKFIQADCFDVAYFNRHRDCVFVSDTGLIDNTPKYFFMIEDYPHPLVNRGLVLGINRMGDSTAPTVDKDTLEAIVHWVTVRADGYGNYLVEPRK